MRLTIGTRPQGWAARTASDLERNRPNSARGGPSGPGQFQLQMDQLGGDSGRRMRAVQSFHPRMVGAHGGGPTAKVHPASGLAVMQGGMGMSGGVLDRRIRERAALPGGATGPEQPLTVLAAAESDAMRSMAALAGRAVPRAGGLAGPSPTGSEVDLPSSSRWGPQATSRFDSSHKNLLESQWLFVDEANEAELFTPRPGAAADQGAGTWQHVGEQGEETQPEQGHAIELASDRARESSSDSPSGAQMRTLKHAVSSYGGGLPASHVFGMSAADAQRMLAAQRAGKGGARASARGSISQAAPVLPRRISNAAVPLMRGSSAVLASPRMPLGAAFGTPRGAGGSLDQQGFG